MGAVIGSLGASQGGLRAFVCRAPAVGRRSVPFGSVEIARRVVTRFGLSVTQPGRDVTVLSSEARLPAASRLVGPRILAIFGGLGTIFGRHPSVVDGLGAIVCSAGAPRGRLVALVCRFLTLDRRAIPCGSVKVARRVITRLGLSVTQPGRSVTVLGSQAGLSTAHPRQLVCSRVFAVFGGEGAIFGCNLSIIDSLGAVVGSLSVPQGRSRAFAQVIRSVFSGCSVPVTLLGLSVTDIRGQIAVAALNVTLARGCEGVLTFIRPAAVLIGECQAARPLWRRGIQMVTHRRPTAVTIAATIPLFRLDSAPQMAIWPRWSYPEPRKQLGPSGSPLRPRTWVGATAKGRSTFHAEISALTKLVGRYNQRA